MSVLIVEDDINFIETLEITYQRLGIADYKIVQSRDEAIACLESEDSFFDFISLDINIPPQRDSIDKNNVYGIQVLSRIIDLCPGTPVLVLTSADTEDHTELFLDNSEKLDVWSTGIKRPTIQYIRKSNTDSMASRLNEISIAIQGLNQIELNAVKGSISTLSENRLIKILVKKRGGVRCDVTQLGGGLSGANVYKLAIYDETGNERETGVAKTGSFEDIGSETENYGKEITRLALEVSPKIVEELHYGGKETALVFYNFAAAHNDNFFQLVGDNKIDDKLKQSVRNMTSRWMVNGESRKTVGDVRRCLVNDEIFSELSKTYNLGWAATFESNQVQVKWCTIHCDLHGANVLVNKGNNTSCLIDYGDIKIGPASIDPLTLELSYLFHPDGIVVDTWPTVDQAKSFFLLDEYTNNCPIEEIIRFCRGWAESVSAGRRELVASLYAYSLRQLKYPETDKRLVLALLEAARNSWN